MDRRKFLKTSLYSIGGVATASAGSVVITPMVFKEKMNFDPNDSFWAHEKSPASPALSENITADIAIIGGGLTGLFAAYHLIKTSPGVKIVLLEAKEVGHGASGRNGGMVLPQYSNESFAIGSDENTHKQVYEITTQAIKDIERLVESEGGGCDLILDGFMHTVRNNDDIDYYEDYVEKVRKLGMPLEFLTRKETSDEIGTNAYACSVYDPAGGQVHPMKPVHILKRLVTRKGVKIYENSPVISVEEGSTVILTVGQNEHQVKAGSLVLATDAYTSKLGFFKNNILVMHTQTAVTAPLTRAQLAKCGWKSRLPFFDSWENLFHLVLTPDNRICIGGGNVEYFFNNSTHYKGDLGKIGEMLSNEISRIYPSLSGIQFEAIWNGVLGITSDGEPSVGVTGSHGNIFYGMAYNGHGVALTYLFGRIIADIYNGNQSKWENTPFFNYSMPFIPPEPFRWMGVRLAISSYKYADKNGISLF